MAKKDIAGWKFGYLTATRPVKKYICNKTAEWMWEAQCICGKKIIKRIGQLTTGDNKSCGCMSRKMKSDSKLEEKNPMWAGDNVGFHALHSWVKKRLPKTDLCNKCKKVPPYDLANKGIYNRDVKNWEWLCRRCHMQSDGRLEKFRSHFKVTCIGA